MDPEKIRELSSPELKEEYLDKPHTWGFASKKRSQSVQLILLICASLSLLGFGVWGALQPNSPSPETPSAHSSSAANTSQENVSSQSESSVSKSGEGSFAALSQRAQVLAASPFAQAAREKDEAPNCQAIRTNNPFAPRSDFRSPHANTQSQFGESQSAKPVSNNSSSQGNAADNHGFAEGVQAGGNAGTSGSSSSNHAVSTPAKTVNCSIGSSAVGNPVSAHKILDFHQGMTAYDALLSMGLSVNSTDTAYGVYVRGIGGLAEKEHGPLSGWMYSVNGVSPNCSCAAYELKPGDTLTWYYVK